MSEELSHIQPKQPVYIEGVGWRNPVEHRMTRWPYWKDARKPGTYMVTLNVNGGKQALDTLAGSTYARFHLINLVAEELCSEGIEHQCVVVTHPETPKPILPKI